MSSNDVSSLKFVPPKEQEKQFPRYASYVHGTDMKTHHGIGFAKNSLNNRMWTREVDPNNPSRKNYAGNDVPNYRYVTKHSFLLEMVDGEYYVLYEIKPGLTKDELPWMVKQYCDTKSSWARWQDIKLWSKHYEGKQLAADPDRYSYRYVNKTMSTDEYVAFRLAVQREQLGVEK